MPNKILNPLEAPYQKDSDYEQSLHSVVWMQNQLSSVIPSSLINDDLQEKINDFADTDTLINLFYKDANKSLFLNNLKKNHGIILHHEILDYVISCYKEFKENKKITCSVFLPYEYALFFDEVINGNDTLNEDNYSYGNKMTIINSLLYFDLKEEENNREISFRQFCQELKSNFEKVSLFFKNDLKRLIIDDDISRQLGHDLNAKQSCLPLKLAPLTYCLFQFMIYPILKLIQVYVQGDYPFNSFIFLFCTSLLSSSINIFSYTILSCKKLDDCLNNVKQDNIMILSSLLSTLNALLITTISLISWKELDIELRVIDFSIYNLLNILSAFYIYKFYTSGVLFRFSRGAELKEKSSESLRVIDIFKTIEFEEPLGQNNHDEIRVIDLIEESNNYGSDTESRMAFSIPKP